MVCKFNGEILEKWRITEEAVLKGSDSPLCPYWPCKQKHLFAVLIFPSYDEDSQAAFLQKNIPKPLSGSSTAARLKKLHCLLL